MMMTAAAYSTVVVSAAAAEMKMEPLSKEEEKC